MNELALFAQYHNSLMAGWFMLFLRTFQSVTAGLTLIVKYDTRCYFNVRSKADISQLNLPHGNDN